MRKEYTLDRIEGDIAVCVSRDDGETVELDAVLLLEAGVVEGGIFSAETDGNELSDIEYLARKTENVKGEARRRLSELFSRRKENEE